MKIENCKLKIAKRDAFTLIEIMVAIAIVGILSAVVLVSMKTYGAKARSSKALAQLSSAMPSMVSCWGNGNDVGAPASGGAICQDSAATPNDIASYGTWPIAGSGDLTNYSYTSTLTSKSSWLIKLSDSANDKKRVCCNSAMMNCKIQDKSGSDWNEDCTATGPTN